MPDTNKWLQLAQEYNDKWQMPNCCGSIDGKHIVHQVITILTYIYYLLKL